MVDGASIHYLSREEEGAKNPLIIMLHGFPENAHTWEGLMAILPTTLDIIAPDLPGYHLSSPLPSETDYQVPSLIGRMAAFIEKVKKGRKVILLGHDWGGAIAWPLAAFHQTLISKLIIVNAAHPSCFTRAIKTSSMQREKSQYIATLIDRNAERILSNTDFQLLKNMIGSCLFEQKSSYSRELLNDWRDPETLSAMLSYYRQMPQQVPQMNVSKKVLDDIRMPEIFIHCPTLLLWGEQDDAFDLSVIDKIEHYVSQITKRFNPSASHWLHREKPEWVRKEMIDFLRA
jgi:pimeloyl-ACP methyl ester carboxylesterase